MVARSVTRHQNEQQPATCDLRPIAGRKLRDRKTNNLLPFASRKSQVACRRLQNFFRLKHVKIEFWAQESRNEAKLSKMTFPGPD
ncbi:hypothetical protein YC2023_041375 [Brassica napus]